MTVKAWDKASLRGQDKKHQIEKQNEEVTISETESSGNSEALGQRTHSLKYIDNDVIEKQSSYCRCANIVKNVLAVRAFDKRADRAPVQVLVGFF